MKSKKLLTSLASVWVFYILFDSISSLFRSGQTRTMRSPFRVTYTIIRSVRSIMLFTLAVLNLVLVFGQLRRESR